MSDNDNTQEKDESSVIRELRNQVKRLEKEASAYREAKLETDRQKLITAGYEKMTPLFEASLKEDPSLTAEDFLETYGLAGTSPQVDGTQDTPEPETTPDPVTGLAQQVASAANTGGGKTREDQLAEDLDKANSAADIQRIMAEYQAGESQFV